MRVSFMLAATTMLIEPAAFAAETAVTYPVPPVATGSCGANRPIDGDRKTPSNSVSKLGDMPPATHIKAVLRLFNGCPAPIVVARGVGSPQPGAKADDPALPGMVIQLGR